MSNPLTQSQLHELEAVSGKPRQNLLENGNIGKSSLEKRQRNYGSRLIFCEEKFDDQWKARK